jgi:hypothetical protein
MSLLGIKVLLSLDSLLHRLGFESQLAPLYKAGVEFIFQLLCLLCPSKTLEERGGCKCQGQ